MRQCTSVRLDQDRVSGRDLESYDVLITDAEQALASSSSEVKLPGMRDAVVLG